MHNRLIIITGASRGIGAGIAIKANTFFNENTIILLMARSEEKMLEIRAEMEKTKSNNLTLENKVIILKQDFSINYKVEEQSKFINEALHCDLKSINELYVFYNHGSMKIGKVEDVADNTPEEFQINTISIWTLLASLNKIFPISKVQKQFHINISSDWARIPHDSVSVYNISLSIYLFELSTKVIK
jgi:short-subunit dehydrogenase